MLRRLNVTITATMLFLLCSSPSLAETTKKPKPPDKFAPNPLEIITPDPLVPRSPKDKQPLTLLEQQQLQTALDELNTQATAKMQAGDKVAAFDIWNRELRLRRYLGSLAEVQALGRVGEIAWRENDRQEVQYITGRLQTIQNQTLPPPKTNSKKTVAQNTVIQNTFDLELLQALGQAYTKVRSPKQALSVYDQVLATVRQQQDTAKEVQTLQTIADLHMAWFDYPLAAATYEQLLSLPNSSNSLQSVTYLQQLAYIYQQAKQPQKAVNIRKQLADIYTQQNNLTELPALQLAIGSDYEVLGRENPSLLEEAFKNYQQAYTTAWELQQYVRASEALAKLIALYRSQGQIEEALQASQILIQTQELASDFYGLMNAYDQIGQMYLERKDYPQARGAFQKGLELAQELKHQETYFSQKISQIEQVSGRSQ